MIRRYRRWPSYQAWRINRDARHNTGLTGYVGRILQRMGLYAKD